MPQQEPENTEHYGRVLVSSYFRSNLDLHVFNRSLKEYLYTYMHTYMYGMMHVHDWFTWEYQWPMHRKIQGKFWSGYLYKGSEPFRLFPIS